MTSLQVIASLVFIIGYALIALEHKLKLNKSSVALIVGSVLWLLVGVSGSEHIGDEIMHAGADVFAIVIFLLAAMSLIEVLAHYEFFDVIRGKLFAWKLDEKKQFLVITLLAFFLSAIIDNLTTTIIMIQISRKFFKNENLLYAAAGVVIAANAGGAFSPIGDVTTIMLWFADKFGTLEVIWKGFLPSFVLYVVSIFFMYRKVKPSNYDVGNEIVTKLHHTEKIVVGIVFASFGLPIVVSLLGLPPYFGLLLGLGIVWMLVDAFKRFVPYETHLNASIESFIQKTDIASLKFFTGILLAVSALHSLGVLEKLAHFVYGDAPSVAKLITGNIGLGFLSAILDNVPLTAIAIQILETTDSSLWVLLALAVGTGGSLLVIGSAAGVVAMGMVKELNFGKYIKIATLPALAGFIAGMGMWAIQYFVFGW